MSKADALNNQFCLEERGFVCKCVYGSVALQTVYDSLDKCAIFQKFPFAFCSHHNFEHHKSRFQSAC